MRSRDPLLWALRLTWLALPFVVGPPIGRALDGASDPVQFVAGAGLWAGWATGLAATLIALPVGLTIVRVLAPAALAAALAAAVAGEPDAAAVALAAVVTVVALAPTISEHFVNGPAYGDERRYVLRIPGMLLLGPVELAWALALAGLAAGALLLAAKQWLWGAAALAVGLPVAVILLRSLHLLARRWLVFVPAGLVVHDPMTLADPVLLRRSKMQRLGPAPAGTDALDLTQRSLGLALQFDLDEPVSFVLIRPGRRTGDSVETDRLIVTPTRPGAVVAEASRRRIRVG